MHIPHLHRALLKRTPPLRHRTVFRMQWHVLSRIVVGAVVPNGWTKLLSHEHTRAACVTVLGAGAGLLLHLVARVTLSSRVKCSAVWVNLSGKVQRSAVWVNLCVSFILYAVSLSLLFITGSTQGPEPPFGLCLTSAALIYAMPILPARLLIEHPDLAGPPNEDGGLHGRKCVLKNITFIGTPYLGDHRRSRRRRNHPERVKRLSGDRRLTQELRRGIFSFSKQHQERVRRRAVLSVLANSTYPDEVTAHRVVNDVWESCFDDTRPFDKIY